MTDLPTEAVEAVAEVLHRQRCHVGDFNPREHYDDARAILTAADLLARIEALRDECAKNAIAFREAGQLPGRSLGPSAGDIAIGNALDAVVAALGALLRERA